MPRSDSPSIRERLIESIGGYSTLMYWYRSVRPRWLWRLTSPFGRPTSRYADEHGMTVKRGPFEGMIFPGEALGHTNYLASKLIGTYEPAVIKFLGEQAEANEVFVDLGSGDGFFMSGVARRAPIRAIGYETNRFERSLAQKIAKENGVSIETRGLADQNELNALPEGKLLLLCDLEGLEEDLLDPAAVPRLRDTTMVVEAHEQFRPAVVSVLTDRFSETHEIEQLYAEPVDIPALPEMSGWDQESARLIVYDGHLPDDSWLTFVPR